MKLIEFKLLTGDSIFVNPDSVVTIYSGLNDVVILKTNTPPYGTTYEVAGDLPSIVWRIQS